MYFFYILTHMYMYMEGKNSEACIGGSPGKSAVEIFQDLKTASAKTDRVERTHVFEGLHIVW